MRWGPAAAAPLVAPAQKGNTRTSARLRQLWPKQPKLHSALPLAPRLHQVARLRHAQAGTGYGVTPGLAHSRAAPLFDAKLATQQATGAVQWGATAALLPPRCLTDKQCCPPRCLAAPYGPPGRTSMNSWTIIASSWCPSSSLPGQMPTN